VSARLTAAIVWGAVLLPIPLSAQVRLAAGLDTCASRIAVSVPGQGRRKIAVLPFPDANRRASALGTYISEELVTRLVNSGSFDVVERGLLDQVLGQLKLGQSGVIDPGTAQQVGKIAGVEAVVLGTITDLDTTVAINCRLIAVETGQLLAAANTRILKDDDVRRILAEHGSDASAEPSGVKRERVGRTIYFGGDWLTVRFESIEMVENSFLRLTFSVQNSFDSDVDLRLNNPAQNTYVVDNSGNSYNFMSGEGLQQNFTRHIRAGENAQFSLLFKIPAATVRSVTLRTTWDAYGRSTSGTKRFVQDNVHIPGR